MTLTEMPDKSHLDRRNYSEIPASEEKSASAMWRFLTSRYMDKSKNNSRHRRSSSGGSNNETIDVDDDDLSRVSMTSTEKNAMAVPPENITVEDSLSEELMKLSMNDRTAVEEEIHGVRCMGYVDETPELLRKTLHEFDVELMAVKNCERRRRKRARGRQAKESKKVGLGYTRSSEADDDVLRNVIRITDYIRIEEEEEATTSTTESGTDSSLIPPPPPIAAKKSFGSITTAFPDGLDGDERLAKKRSCYINDPEVRLRFLRSERFDAKKAVKRFVIFLDFAQELYGDFIADRPMRISDIKTREEKRAMANIHFQFLPFRDRSGRRVFVSVGCCGYDVEPKIRCKILWYMFWIASEDIESQRKGLIVIGWPSDITSSASATGNPLSEPESDESVTGTDENLWERGLRYNIANIEGVYQMKAIDGLPIRLTALHFCIQNRPVYRILNSLFYFAIDRNYKSRYKVHIGEPMEIRYKLQSFGIPVDLLPVTHTMTLKRQSHLQWIAYRKCIEQDDKSNSPLSVDPSYVVECPRSCDVIIGKAKYTNNPGNVFYRSLIEATHDEHMSLSKREKVEMTWKIVREMEERDGRFLEFNKQLKVFVAIKDRNVMRQKVAQSYKEYKRNAHVVRVKRQQEEEEHRQLSSDKRQKMSVPIILESETSVFTGCFSRCDDNNSNGFSSMHFFTNM